MSNNPSQTIIEGIDELSPESAANVSIFQDPFTVHFDDMVLFLNSSLKTTLKEDLGFSSDLITRLTDNEGNSIDERVFSQDNLLLYDSLFHNLSGFLKSSSFLSLKNTPIWYEGNVTEYQYGFIESLNGTDGEIIDDTRNLITQLTALKLLINPYNINSKNAIEGLFNLINSSEFFDETNGGFYISNSSGVKNSISNLYAILTNFLLHKSTGYTNTTVKNRAYELANETMNDLVYNMWDNINFGFYDYTTDALWNHGGLGDYKRLDVNALGIMALLDTWVQTGMNESSLYFTNATLLYDQLNDNLWNGTYNAYEFRRYPDWGPGTGDIEHSINLGNNSLMMRACLKLFDVTGNISYYNRAIELFEFFENYLYNDTIDAYMNSISYVNDTNVDFNANLRLCETLIDALDIYSNTVLSAQFNESVYIIDQHTMNLTSAYNIIKTNKYYDPVASQYKTYQIYQNITDANVTYLFRYSNETIFKTIYEYIEFNVTTGEIAEVTKITCNAEVNGTLNGTYFLLNTPSQNFYIWFDLNDTGFPDPGLTGISIEIKNVTLNATKEQVASNITAYLIANGNFSVGLSSENITVTNKEVGTATNASDGIGITATNYTFEILTDGSNRTVTENTILYEIPEDLPLQNNYEIFIYSFAPYFKTAHTLGYFNVISGLVNTSFDGFGDVDHYYQGQTINLSLSIRNDRSQNITLNVSMEATGIENVTNTEVNFTGESEVTIIPFNITALIDANPGYINLKFTITRGNVTYIEITQYFLLENALEYNNIIYSSRVISGDDLQVSLNIINKLPNNTQDLNITFSGDYIQTSVNAETLEKHETKTVSYTLDVSDNIYDTSISISVAISKGSTDFYTDTLSISVIQKVELISVSCPESAPQGEIAYLIIVITNNLDTSEDFTLYINQEAVGTDFTRLGPGENRIVKEIPVSINPYGFGKETYDIMLKDGNGNIIFMKYFEIEIELSVFNLVVFYVLPVLIPIGIIIFYKNKDLKNKLLRR